jgi:hypothetical protein
MKADLHPWAQELDERRLDIDTNFYSPNIADLNATSRASLHVSDSGSRL